MSVLDLFSPEMKLNDRVINTLVEMAAAITPDGFFLDSLAVIPDLSAFDLTAMRVTLEMATINANTVLFIPIHLAFDDKEADHWVLAILVPQFRLAVIADSAPNNKHRKM